MTPDELRDHIDKLARVAKGERVGTGGLDERQLARFGQLAGRHGGGLPLTPVEAAELDALTVRWIAGGASTEPTPGGTRNPRPRFEWLADEIADDLRTTYPAANVTTGSPWMTVEEMQNRLRDEENRHGRPQGDPLTVRITAQDRTQDAFARASDAVRGMADRFAKAAGAPFKAKATAYAVPVPDRHGDGVHWRLECSAGCPAPAWLSPSKASAISACEGHIELVHR